MKEYTLREVAQHKQQGDLWMVIQGKVLDVTTYARDHPGGLDLILETAGTDATEAFNDAGHSEEAFEIMEPMVIGTLRGATVQAKPQPKAPKVPTPIKKSGNQKRTISVSSGGALVAVIVLGGVLGTTSAPGGIAKSLTSFDLKNSFGPLSQALVNMRLPQLENLGFLGGFVTAIITSIAAVGLGLRKLSELADVGGGFTKYPRAIKAGKQLQQDLEIASNVYLLSFELPSEKTVLGLPVGQHVTIKADVNGKSVSRSYTPVSNNTDLGCLKLVIRCYPDGQLTGQYLQKLELGDEVAFRGPKGAMRYKRGLTKRISMVAGGTGITPMYQLIRAICEDDEDTTQVSLIYANRSPEDILLLKELNSFARRYPKNFKVWYMVDKAPAGWKYGEGYVNADVMKRHLYAPNADTKLFLCGPPGMINACKKTAASLGFEVGGAVPKMTDQVFTF
ncbi:hypothetical protein NPX13_g2846 [Xylaria arbuscula]|uniref:Cytochrome b5 reductase n=1 Tax=Xylaria arbuscula TaxID=114810 RepID=A0A9W8TPY9_9PEZI|nr:hypothetical protein NPX13_g2846 [Xylaria arbuscula]